MVDAGAAAIADRLARGGRAERRAALYAPRDAGALRTPRNRPPRAAMPADDAPGGMPPLGFAVAQLHGIYILAENADGLVVVDMHAAHERIGYEKLKAAHDGAGLRTQPLLVPQRWPCPSARPTSPSARRHAGALGFEVHRSGPQSLLLRSVPALLATAT
jgi:DNA mismatch repair protein MutL